MQFLLEPPILFQRSNKRLAAGAQERDRATAGGVRSTEREEREPIPPAPLFFEAWQSSNCYAL